MVWRRRCSMYHPGRSTSNYRQVLTGTATITVISERPQALLPPSVSAFSPAIFTTNGTQGAVLNQNSSPNSAANPATAGTVVVILPPDWAPRIRLWPWDNSGSGVLPFNLTVNTTTVTINGQSAAVAFSGAALGFAGLYQINATVPIGTPAGSAVPLQLTIGGQVAIS